MQSNKTELLVLLKNQLVSFLDELIDSFPKETDFVIFRIFLNNQIPIEDVMNYIVNKLLPNQEMIKTKDDAFFLNNNILFGDFNSDKMKKVNHFKEMWQSSEVDNEDRNVIWRWFSSFINIASKYKNLMA